MYQVAMYYTINTLLSQGKSMLSIGDQSWRKMSKETEIIF
jgi:hypothetical protein